MKKILIALVTVLLVSFLLITKETAQGKSINIASINNEKVTICHIPPGNPANAHAITVSINAVPAHMAHGDAIGDCTEATGQ